MSQPVDAATPGRISVRRTKVSTRRTPEGVFLFRAPSARVVTLDPAGERLWNKIDEGADDITELIREHQEEAGVPAEAAAFRVLSFLDVLRTEDFISFTLPGGTEGAPLLDVTLDTPTPLEFQTADPESTDALAITPAIRAGRIATVEVNRPTMTLAEVRNLVEQRFGESAGTLHRLKVLDLDRPELTEATFRRVATGALTEDAVRERRFVELPSPSGTTTLADIQRLQGTGGVGVPAKRAASRVVVIIVITDGPIIVIVIDGGSGPTFGKSRNACKTVCV
jgi:hypothetical protein